MRKSLLTIFIAIVVSAKLIAGDTITIKNAFFLDPVSSFEILISKNKVDKNLILIDIDDDLNPKESIQVDYTIASSSNIISRNNVNLIPENGYFQIMVENFKLKHEIEPVTIEITIKKDGVSPNTFKDTCNLYYIHNVVQIESFINQGKTFKYSKRDTVWGVNNSDINLTYSTKLNYEALGLKVDDIIENPFYKYISSNLYPSGKNDTIKYTKNIDLIFNQKIELQPGFNKVVYRMYDNPIDSVFSDSIMFFYLKIDENQQKEFCKTDEIIHLKAIPEGGEFSFAENSIGLQSGILGNTNVFDPLQTSDALKSFKAEYKYRFVLDKKEFFFTDTMRIIVNGLPPDFSIEGKPENCAFENGVEYKLVSNDNSFDATKYLINWKINGENISGNDVSQIVDWGNKTKSEISVEIADKNTGCSVSGFKLVKVGSNKIPASIANIDTVGIDKGKNNILLYSDTTKNVNQYIWNLPNGNDTITPTNYILLPAVSGIYSLRTAYKGNPGCYSDYAWLKIEDSQVNKSIPILVYPNPFTSSIHIENQKENKESIQFSFNLKNQIGDIIVKGNFTGKRYEIDCSTVPNGLYILEITDGIGTISRKIVK